MAIELAERLINTEAASRKDVDAALLHHVRDGVPFVTALLEVNPGFVRALERELARLGGTAADDVAPDLELVRRLPSGICSQLLAFPIGRSEAGSAIEVLIVDPLTRHAANELSFHLGAQVKLIRGRRDYITQQVALLDGRNNDARSSGESAGSSPRNTPPFVLGRGLPSGSHSAPDVPELSSLPPPPPGALRSLDSLLELEEEREPAAPVSVVAPSSDEFQRALSDLAVAEHADAVVDALLFGLSGLCREVWVFALRGESFRSRAHVVQPEPPRRDVSVDVAPGQHPLASAVELGQYLGPLGEAHESLGFLGATYQEVCATRVTVAKKPALVVLAGGFRSSFDVSLRSDHLARAASDALGRIVLAKKK